MVRSAASSALKGRCIAVTGATGFIGGAVARALVAAGARVVAPLRHASGRAALPPGVEARVAPFRPGPALAEALAGAEAVAHFAHDMRAGAAENLAAFEALLGAVRAAGIGRLVQAGSAVVDPGWPDGVVTASPSPPPAPPAPRDYRGAKAAMEVRLAAFAAETGIAAPVLRPTLVYGPGSRIWTEALVRRLLSGPVVLPEEDGFAPVVFVEDVAGAALAALSPEGPRGGAFPVTGPEAPTWAAWYEAHAAILGRGRVVRRPLAEILARLGPEPDPDAPPAGPSAAARVSALARSLIGSARVDALAARARGLMRPAGPAGAEVWPDRFLLSLYRAQGRVDLSGTEAAAPAGLGWSPAHGIARGLALSSGAIRALAG